MTITALKKEVKEEARTNDDVLFKISKAMNKSIGTVRNWFYNDSEMLTNMAALKVISEHTNIPILELTEEVEVEARKAALN